MSDFDLQRWLRRAQVQGIKLGLDNIRTALRVLGQPQASFPSLLVGGTNGKGSVVAMAEAMLIAEGRSVGATTSPHLTHYRERFRVDGVTIAEDELLSIARTVAATIDPHDAVADITFFELTIALAMALFHRRRVDCAVVEVGMGGEFDATRAANPAVAALTSVDLDHVRHLGPTVQDIARTKARVAERGMTIVVGERREDRLGPIREEIAAAEATGLYAGSDFDLRPGGDGLFVFEGMGRRVDGIQLGLRGLHQRSNAAVAVASVLSFVQSATLPPLSGHAIRTGLGKAFVPGRQEEVRLDDRITVLLDGAHNTAGAESLATTLLDRQVPRRTLLFASMKDKDRSGIYDALLPHVDAVWCCKGDSTPRFAEPADLVSEIAQRGVPATDVGTPAAGFAMARRSLPDGAELLVAGSLYLVGDVRPLLGLG